MRTTAAETERNNQIIIDAAIKVFSEKGYDNTNMQDIADEAGITRGPLYYRYKTKLDIFRAAFEAQNKKALDDYMDILSRDKHILEVLREDLEYCVKSTGIGIPALDMMFSTNPELQKVYEQTDRDCQILFDRKVERIKLAIEKGELVPETNAEKMVKKMFVFGNSLTLAKAKAKRGYVNSFDMVSDDEIMESIDDFLDGIKVKYCNL